MSRPREDHVPTERGECPEHGMVEFRLHRYKVRNGKVYYNRRCPNCHAEKNLESYYRKRSQTS